jgi:hypothetical protein
MSTASILVPNNLNIFCNSITTANSSGSAGSNFTNINVSNNINNSGGFAYYNNTFTTGTAQINALSVVGSSTVSALQANSIASLSTISAAGNISSSGAYSGASSAITGLGSFGSISSSGGISSSGALTAPSCSISGLGSFGSISSSGNINSSGSITSGTANFTNINVSGGNSVLSNISTLNSVQFGASTQQINIHRGLAGTQYIFSLPSSPLQNVTANLYDPGTSATTYMMLGIQPTLFYNNTGHQALTVSNAGTTIFVIADAAYTITIPDISSGVIGTRYKFILSSRSSAVAVTLNTNTPNNAAFTAIIVNGGTAGGTGGVAQNTITFSSAAVAGDYIELISNGILWLCNAGCQTAGNITCP